MRARWRRAQTPRARVGVTRSSNKEDEMILATTTVEDLDQFVKIYSTKGAEKRKLHGSKGSTVFRDPNEADRVWAIFDWDLEGWEGLRLRSRGPADHAGGRAQGQAAGRPSSSAGSTPRSSSERASGSSAERCDRQPRLPGPRQTETCRPQRALRRRRLLAHAGPEPARRRRRRPRRRLRPVSAATQPRRAARSGPTSSACSPTRTAA